MSVRELLKQNVRDLTIASIMRRPAPVCSQNDPIREVMKRMTRERLRHLVVMARTGSLAWSPWSTS